MIDKDQQDNSLLDVFDSVKFEGSVVDEQVLFQNFDKLALRRECLIVHHDVHSFLELNRADGLVELLTPQVMRILKLNKELRPLHQCEENAFCRVECKDHLSILWGLKLLDVLDEV